MINSCACFDDSNSQEARYLKLSWGYWNVIWEKELAFLRTANPSVKWSPLMRLYYGVWGLLLAWSLGSLLFYRAPASLGRAAIGEEIIHFGLPLLLAFFVSILGFGLSHPTSIAARAAPFCATIVLSILEAFFYLHFVF